MYEFTCAITDTLNPPLLLIEEAAVDLDIEIDWRSGEPAPIIRDVYIYGKRIPQTVDALTAALRKRIEDLAYADLREGDGCLWTQINKTLADDGITYHGLPGDPDGHWGAAA